jgi:glycine oxidase
LNKIDYIIIGGGLAGITLAHHLHARNLSFHLYYDEGLCSSRIAAGLFNPITGRKMVKTWKADQLFPYLLDFYKKAEEKTGSTFLYPKVIYRPFFLIEEQNDWIGRSSDPAYQQFIENIYTRPQFAGRFNDPFGGLSLNMSGWVDISKYIDDSLRYFKQLKHGVKIFPEKIDINELKVDEEGIICRNAKARNLIFSEGIGVQNNLYFNWLPLKPLKGEIMDVKLPFTINKIFNRGVFILPIRGNVFRIGSTYDHHDLSWNATVQGKKQLTEKLKALINCDFDILDHTAGIRPATRDRRPFVGRHPKFKNIFIFNGLGTKGVSLAPYFAHQLVEFIENTKDLDEEVNIHRFFSLYCI